MHVEERSVQNRNIWEMQESSDFFRLRKHFRSLFYLFFYPKLLLDPTHLVVFVFSLLLVVFLLFWLSFPRSSKYKE